MTSNSTANANTKTIAERNPLRYRGYVYDTETSLYYLQSRYYNPATGRFINADSYTSTGSLLGNNMFAYCLNNPVNGYDPCGTCFHHWKFWEDCDECKGKTILERINETLEQIAEVNRQQQELQNEITMTQVQMIQDAGQAVVDAYVHSVELEAEAQYERDMTTRKAATIFAENPAMAANLAINIVGVGVSLVSFYGSIGVIAIPATANIVLSGIGLGCSLWGGFDAVEEFWNALLK